MTRRWTIPADREVAEAVVDKLVEALLAARKALAHSVQSWPDVERQVDEALLTAGVKL